MSSPNSSGKANKSRKRALPTGGRVKDAERDDAPLDEPAPEEAAPPVSNDIYMEVFGADARGNVLLKTEYSLEQGSFHLNPNHLHALIHALLGQGINHHKSPFVVSHTSLIRRVAMLTFTGLSCAALDEAPNGRDAVLALMPQCAPLMCPGSVTKAYALAPLLLRTTLSKKGASAAAVPAPKTGKSKKKKKKRMDQGAMQLTQEELEFNEFPLRPGPDGKPLIDFVSTSEYHAVPPPGAVDVAALDCEMVITVQGIMEVARISLMDEQENVLMDVFVKPQNPISDYCTRWSGITPETPLELDLATARDRLLQFVSPTTILVGHSLDSDLKCLRLVHTCCADTSVLFPHSQGPPYKRGLKDLASTFLKEDIQGGEHDSVQDARVALHLFKLKEKNGPAFGVPPRKDEIVSIFETVSSRGGALVIEDSEAAGLRVVVESGCAAADVQTAPTGASVIDALISKHASANNSQLVVGALTWSPEWALHVERLWAAVAPNTLMVVCGGRGSIEPLLAIQNAGGDVEQIKAQAMRARKTMCWLGVKP